MRLPVVGLGAFAAVALAALRAHAAALALVLAVDVSASVSADSYVLQHDGIARAFEDPRLAAAIAAASGGIEALVLEWSDPDKIAVSVDWTPIADAQSARAFAAAVRATRRSSSGITAIGPALLAAAAELERLPQPAARRVIDISGDGMANFGGPPAAARDRIVAQGIAINGLAILTEEPWLDSYYRRYVVGGPAAFVIAARTFDDFAEAMLRKLVQEVAGAPLPRQPHRRRRLSARLFAGIDVSLFAPNLRTASGLSAGNEAGVADHCGERLAGILEPFRPIRRRAPAEDLGACRQGSRLVEADRY